MNFLEGFAIAFHLLEGFAIAFPLLGTHNAGFLLLLLLLLLLTHTETLVFFFESQWVTFTSAITARTARR